MSAAYDLPEDAEVLALECAMDRVHPRIREALKDLCTEVAEIVGGDIAKALADDLGAVEDILTDRVSEACAEIERKHGYCPPMPWRDANTVTPATTSKEAA